MNRPLFWTLGVICLALSVALVFTGMELSNIKERQERIADVISFTARGATITHYFERGVGWLDNYSIVQSEQAMGFYSIDPRYPDVGYFEGYTREWVNFTIDHDTLERLDSCWTIYAYSPVIDDWVSVRHYAM